MLLVTKGYGWCCNQSSVENYNLTRTQEEDKYGNMGDFGTGYVRKTPSRWTNRLPENRVQQEGPKNIKSEDASITPAEDSFTTRNSIRLRSNQSVPGPAKRLIRFRDAVELVTKPFTTMISRTSYVIQQGVRRKVAVKDIVNEIDGHFLCNRQ